MTGAYYNEFDPKTAEWLRQLIKNGDITPGDVDDRSITEVTADDIRGYARIHFFAGIGTWDYALNQAGWGAEPVWTASLPCQPFSVAGKGLGKSDERHLLPHFIELVRQCRPTTLFGEQVPGAIKHGWLDDLYAEMEACEYAVGSIIIGAHSVGSPHIRQRLYWVANSIDNSCKREIGRCDGETQSREIGNRKSFIVSRESSGTSADVRWVGISNSAGLQQGVKAAEGARHRSPVESASGFIGMAYTSDSGRQSQSGDRSSEIFRSSLQPEEQREQFRNMGAAPCCMADAGGQGLQRRIGAECGDKQFARKDSMVNWIYCRDNKYRPIEPGVLKMAHGVAAGMVCCCNTSIETSKFEKEKEINASEHKTDSGKILPSLLCEDGTEHSEREARGSESFQKKKVLQSYVHGQCLRGCNEGYEFEKRLQTISEESEGMLRGVFKDNRLTCSSCGRKSLEQQSIEFDDIVRGVSQGSTLSELFCTEGAEYLQALRKTGDEERALLDAQYPLSEVWESIDDEEKNRVRVHFNNRAWVIDEAINPLVDGAAEKLVRSGDTSASIDANSTQEARAMRLKGYGNAIQAQTATMFINAYVDCMVGVK